MDILRLFDGLMMLAVVLLAAGTVARADTWRATVNALHLRWEREQRQAGPGGVSLEQRQAAQADFELLVAKRPIRILWLHVALGVGAIALALLLAWNLDDFRWIGLWLLLPIGVAAAIVFGIGWMIVNQANAKLTAISSSLYGPAPPRVKVRSIQATDGDITIS